MSADFYDLSFELWDSFTYRVSIVVHWFNQFHWQDPGCNVKPLKKELQWRLEVRLQIAEALGIQSPLYTPQNISV